LPLAIALKADFVIYGKRTLKVQLLQRLEGRMELKELVLPSLVIALILTQVPQKQLVARRKFRRLIATAVAQPSLSQPCIRMDD
jgi:hypothetical protein